MIVKLRRWFVCSSSADVDVQVVGIVLESQDARDDNIITLLDGLAVATAEFAGFDYEAYFEIKVSRLYCE